MPQFAFVRWLPNEGKKEAGKCFDDQGGCDPSFFEQLETVRALCWFGMERGAFTEEPHGCSTREIQSESCGCFPYGWSVFRQEELACGSVAGEDDVVGKQTQRDAQMLESISEP